MKSLDHPNSHCLRSSSPLIFVERVLATSSITKATALFKSATPKPNVAVPADFVAAAADDDDESFSRRSFSLSSVVVAVGASLAAPLDEGGEDRRIRMRNKRPRRAKLQLSCCEWKIA